MTPTELQKKVDKSGPWFHSIDFGDGVVAAGSIDPEVLQQSFEWLCLPELKGKTLLDVGAWNGYYTFETEKREAEVTALDSYCWNGPGTGNKKGFDLAHQHFNSKAKTIELEVVDICEEKVGRHDVVLFLGVLYHLKHPLLALEKVASVADELVVVETEIDLCGVQEPAMRFYPGTELGGDPSNWWGPNPAAVLAMMKTVGLKDCKMVHKRNHNPEQGRAVFHGHVA